MSCHVLCPKQAKKHCRLFLESSAQPGEWSFLFCSGIPWAWIFQGLKISSLCRRVVLLGGGCMTACTQGEVSRSNGKLCHKSPTVLTPFFLSAWRLGKKFREKTNADIWQALGSVLRKAGERAAPRPRARVAGGERTDSWFSPRRGLEVAGEPRPRALLIAAASCSK